MTDLSPAATPAAPPTTAAAAVRAVREVPDRVSLDGVEDRWDGAWTEQGTYAFDRSKTRETRGIALLTPSTARLFSRPVSTRG